MVACGGCCANMVVVSHEIEEQAMNEERKIKRKREEEREGYRARRWSRFVGDCARWWTAAHGGALRWLRESERSQAMSKNETRKYKEEGEGEIE